MGLRIFQPADSDEIFIQHGTIGPQPKGCLQAVGTGTGHIKILNKSKANELEDDFFEVNANYTEFVDLDGIPWGASEQETVNNLNALFTGDALGVPTITSPLTVNVNQFVPVNYVASATNGVGYYWNNLPAGVSVSNSDQRVLQGAIAVPGTYTPTLTVANAFGQDTETITFNVASTFTNTKSVRFNNQDHLSATAGTANPLYRPSNGSGVSDAWSIAFWIYPGTSGNQNQTILFFGGNDDANEGHVELKFVGSNDYLSIEYGSRNNRLTMSTANNTLPQGQWTHVLVTYDGGTTGVASGSVSDYYGRFKVFLDGSAVSTSNSHNNFGFSGQIPADLFRVGRSAGGEYLRNNTYIEELAIWASDQTANVAAIYNTGTPFDLRTLSSDPEHYWRMGDGDTFPLLQDSGGAGTDYDFIMFNMTSSDIVSFVP